MTKEADKPNETEHINGYTDTEYDPTDEELKECEEDEEYEKEYDKDNYGDDFIDDLFERVNELEIIKDLGLDNK